MLDTLAGNVGTSLTAVEMGLRLILAAIYGGIIGLDRELKDRPAGLRTHMITSLAACVFTILSLELFLQVRALENPVSADPIRIIEAVTAGVAFLAAGAIISGRGRVRGLTTGAGMWLAGSIGLACGAGFYVLATMALVLAVIILTVLRRLEVRLPSKNEGKD